MQQPGKYSCSVQVKKRAVGKDGLGQPNGAWVLHSEDWAYILFEGGAESIRADQVTSIARASVRLMGIRTDVTAAMRVEYADLGMTFKIKVVLPDLVGREYTDLVCEVVS
jgi:SPP1 family predicted phage head-tail adaptor